MYIQIFRLQVIDKKGELLFLHIYRTLYDTKLSHLGPDCLAVHSNPRKAFKLCYSESLQDSNYINENPRFDYPMLQFRKLLSANSD